MKVPYRNRDLCQQIRNHQMLWSWQSWLLPDCSDHDILLSPNTLCIFFASKLVLPTGILQVIMKQVSMQEDKKKKDWLFLLTIWNCLIVRCQMPEKGIRNRSNLRPKGNPGPLPTRLCPSTPALLHALLGWDSNAPYNCNNTFWLVCYRKLCDFCVCGWSA